MGYFSNSSEAEIYQAQYCFNCVHWPDDPDDPKQCLIWEWHLAWSGKDFISTEIFVLDSFIPPLHKGVLGNDECRMFWQRND